MRARMWSEGNASERPTQPDKGRQIIRVIPCHVACAHAGGCGAGGGRDSSGRTSHRFVAPSEGSDGRCVAAYAVLSAPTPPPSPLPPRRRHHPRDTRVQPIPPDSRSTLRCHAAAPAFSRCHTGLRASSAVSMRLRTVSAIAAAPTVINVLLSLSGLCSILLM